VTRTSRGVAFALTVAATLAAGDARADGADDSWTSTDKFIHYGVSAGIAVSGYVVGAMIFDTRAHALATGAVATTVAGVGKELADLTGYGNASFKDLAWNGLGMVTGLAVAWGIDLLIRGISTEHPAFAVRRGGIAF
jgi:putative lipoprotein